MPSFPKPGPIDLHTSIWLRSSSYPCTTLIIARQHVGIEPQATNLDFGTHPYGLGRLLPRRPFELPPSPYDDDGHRSSRCLIGLAWLVPTNVSVMYDELSHTTTHPIEASGDQNHEQF